MAEKNFTLRNLDTGRSYEVTGNENTTAAMVWASEKCWFQAGTMVEITEPDGRKEQFIHE